MMSRNWLGVRWLDHRPGKWAAPTAGVWAAMQAQNWHRAKALQQIEHGKVDEFDRRFAVGDSAP
jgi:hypothetical protein